MTPVSRNWWWDVFFGNVQMSPYITSLSSSLGSHQHGLLAGLACGEPERYGSFYRQTHRWCFTFTPGRKWLTDWIWLGSLCPCTSGVGWMVGGEGGRVRSGEWQKCKDRVCVSVCRGRHDMCVAAVIASFFCGWEAVCVCVRVKTQGQLWRISISRFKLNALKMTCRKVWGA